MITVLHLITGLTRGGAETNLARLVTSIDPSRFRSIVVAMLPPTPLFRELAAQGVEMHSLGMRRGLPSPSAVLRVRAIIKRTRPDIIQTWLYHADLLGTVVASSGSARLVWNIRNSDMGGRGGRLSHRTIVGVLSRLSKRPDAVITNSRSAQLSHAEAGYRPRRWVYLPNGYDTTLFRPNVEAGRRLRGSLSIPEDTLLIGLLARFDPMKDHETFLAAAASVARAVPNAKFLLAGANITRDNTAMIEQVDRHGLRDSVLLLGERRDIPDLLASLDILALSSAYGEGFPNVVAEAMACAVPVVATDVGDTRSVLNAGGTIVPPRDPDALSRALVTLAQMDSEARRRIGLEGRQVVLERFTIDAMVTAYESLYSQLVEDAPDCGQTN
jgi:glycosyltransferase involved in cell wall biosynthesis